MSRQRPDTTTARRSPAPEVVGEAAAVRAGRRPCICTRATPDTSRCRSARPIRRPEPACRRWSRDVGGWTAGRPAEVAPRCVCSRLCRLDRRRRTRCSCRATIRCPCVAADRRSCQSSCTCRRNRNRKYRSWRSAAPEAGTRLRLSRPLIDKNWTAVSAGRNICGR